jgi:hypothetical protein
MALKEQTTSTAVPGNTRDYEDFPSFPEELVAKFPFLAPFKSAQEQAWMKLKANLRGIEDDLEALRRKVNSQ